jgi:hypothetical protein
MIDMCACKQLSVLGCATILESGSRGALSVQSRLAWRKRGQHAPEWMTHMQEIGR